uniref:Uncharacterized protein n=1 Tax=Arundo donax TaxID=35708 RepID=A0A0A9CM10_ARUDO
MDFFWTLASRAVDLNLIHHSYNLCSALSHERNK